MTSIEEDTRFTAAGTRVHWGAVVAGALCAAALVPGAAQLCWISRSRATEQRQPGAMHRSAFGFFRACTSLLVALASYGLGGYIAGWIRSWSPAIATEDADTTEGIHGLLVWAIAAIASNSGDFSCQQSPRTPRLTAPARGDDEFVASVGSENLLAYDIDRLLRSDGRPIPGDNVRSRAEAGRILMTKVSVPGSPPRIANIWSVWWLRRQTLQARKPNAGSTRSSRGSVKTSRAPDSSTTILAFHGRSSGFARFRGCLVCCGDRSSSLARPIANGDLG